GAGLGLGGPGTLGFAFIVQFFALGDGDLALDLSALQVNFCRDQREAFFLADGSEFIDFASMEQEFAIMHRGVVLPVSVGIMADVGVEEPCLAVQDIGISILQLDLAVLGGFHLGPREYHAGLKSVEKKVIVAGGSVVAEDFEGRIFLVSQI